MTQRPVALPTEASTPKDDGFFGPESITWRVFSAPSQVVGATAAVLVQMLHPRVVGIIDQSSAVYTDADTRGALTAAYGYTITFADKETAERAGALLRNIHNRKRAVDPWTGEEYRASQPDLLLYVHNATLWALLRGCDRWGPKLSHAQKDRFVEEQKEAARLVGIDPGIAPSTLAEVETYMEEMRPKLAFTPASRRFMDLILPPKLPTRTDDLVTYFLMQAAVELMTPEQRELYGQRWGWLRKGFTTLVAGLIIGAAWIKAPYEKAIPAMRAQVAEHAFGRKVKAVKSKIPTTPAGSIEASH